jgi:hypothetical protein
MVFSTVGAGNPPAARTLEADAGTWAWTIRPIVTATSVTMPGLLSASSGECLTQAVRITLTSEQISLCAPTNLPFNVVEDSVSDPYVSYAGLDQMDGFGIVNIKATAAGNAPGIGRPVYNSGDVVAYRQAVWQIESSKKDRIVSNGPTGLFWNETVPGIQVDLTLPTYSGEMKVRSIEWYVEHNNRLWSFIITWDIEMQNAAGWEAASTNFSAQKSDNENLADTAVNLGTAFLESKAASEISSMGGPVDMGTPPWWSGVCNDNNFYPAMGAHSFVLGTPWHGLYACGPFNSMHLVHFFTGANGEFEFQCVELVMRFLYLEWGITPFSGNGNTIKDHYPASSMVFYSNDGTHAIVPGDIITEDGSTPNSSGHAVVVTGVFLDGNGTGTVSILEQNSSSAGQRSLSVKKWQVQPDAWTWGSTIQGWLHVKVNASEVMRLFLPIIISPG